MFGKNAIDLNIGVYYSNSNIEIKEGDLVSLDDYFYMVPEGSFGLVKRVGGVNFAALIYWLGYRDAWMLKSEIKFVRRNSNKLLMTWM